MRGPTKRERVLRMAGALPAPGRPTAVVLAAAVDCVGAEGVLACEAAAHGMSVEQYRAYQNDLAFQEAIQINLALEESRQMYAELQSAPKVESPSQFPSLAPSPPGVPSTQPTASQEPVPPPLPPGSRPGSGAGQGAAQPPGPRPVAGAGAGAGQPPHVLVAARPPSGGRGQQQGSCGEGRSKGKAGRGGKPPPQPTVTPEPATHAGVEAAVAATPRVHAQQVPTAAPLLSAPLRPAANGGTGDGGQQDRLARRVRSGFQSYAPPPSRSQDTNPAVFASADDTDGFGTDAFNASNDGQPQSPSAAVSKPTKAGKGIKPGKGASKTAAHFDPPAEAAPPQFQQQQYQQQQQHAAAGYSNSDGASASFITADSAPGGGSSYAASPSTGAGNRLLPLPPHAQNQAPQQYYTPPLQAQQYLEQPTYSYEYQQPTYNFEYHAPASVHYRHQQQPQQPVVVKFQDDPQQGQQAQQYAHRQPQGEQQYSHQQVQHSSSQQYAYSQQQYAWQAQPQQQQVPQQFGYHQPECQQPSYQQPSFQQPSYQQPEVAVVVHKVSSEVTATGIPPTTSTTSFYGAGSSSNGAQPPTPATLPPMPVKQRTCSAGGYQSLQYARSGASYTPPLARQAGDTGSSAACGSMPAGAGMAVEGCALAGAMPPYLFPS